MINSKEELIKNIASTKLKCKETKKRYNAIIDNDINKKVGLKNYTKKSK